MDDLGSAEYEYSSLQFLVGKITLDDLGSAEYE